MGKFKLFSGIGIDITNKPVGNAFLHRLIRDAAVMSQKAPLWFENDDSIYEIRRVDVSSNLILMHTHAKPTIRSSDPIFINRLSSLRGIIAPADLPLNIVHNGQQLLQLKYEIMFEKTHGIDCITFRIAHNG